MSLFGKNTNEVNYVGGEKHFVDVLKNRSANDTLIFRNPEEDFNTGTTLVVAPGEQAIFVNEGNIEQVFTSGTYSLTTANYPFISRLRNSLSGGVSAFHCIVYFVRTATSREIKWGTDAPIKVMDMALADPVTGLGIETDIRARGSYRVKVSDAAMLLTQLIGGNYDLQEQEALQQFFRDQFLGNIVATLTANLSAWQGPLIQAPSQILVYSKNLQDALDPIVHDYGLQMMNFTIAGLDIVDNEERREAMALVSKNREANFGSKAEQLRYENLHTSYQEAQTLGALRDAASNPGDSGSLMGAGIGLTMGAGLGQVASGLFGSIPATQTVANPSVSAQAVPVSSAAAEARSDDPVERLGKLKKLLDAGLISDEEYQAKKTEILKNI